jgi:chemotaxis protein MotB
MTTPTPGAPPPAPIIIKRIKKAAHAHHGGMWKVAYADFVTAMMAFFLLLWLLNVTTDIERKGIAEYFAPASISPSASGAAGVFGGQTITAPGAMINDSTPIGTSKNIPQPDESDRDRKESPGSGQPQGPEQEKGEVTTGGPKTLEELSPKLAELLSKPTPKETPKPETMAQNPDAKSAKEKSIEDQRKQEEELFKKAEAALREAIKGSGLADLEKNLIIDSTPEGLRIQIVDREGYSLFAAGSAMLAGKSRQLVSLVGLVLARLPNKLSITGHTDNTPFPPASRRNNWQLSTERAASSLETMMASGVDSTRINALVGKADREPLVTNNPADPQNRRLSIVLLRRSYVEQIQGIPPATSSTPTQSVPSAPPSPFSTPSNTE